MIQPFYTDTQSIGSCDFYFCANRKIDARLSRVHHAFCVYFPICSMISSWRRQCNENWTRLGEYKKDLSDFIFHKCFEVFYYV